MAFSESLTVRILGDSSELQRELNSVLNRLDTLKERLSQVSNSSRSLGNSFQRLSQATKPLQQVSNLIGRIGQQLQGISQQPVVVNVSPALQSLGRLTQAAYAAAAAIQAIPVMGPVPFGASPGPVAPPAAAPRRMVSGGLVAGPTGIDRIPAKLTAGEFVVNRSAVEALGVGFLDRLNSVSATRTLNSLQPPTSAGQGISLRMHRATHSTPPSPTSSSQTTNHFGGIHVQVTEQVDAESFFRNLHLQGVGRRNRLG